jgi:hypothetical protein
MLKKCILQFALMGLIGLIVMTQPVKADTTGLADWCVNLNGDINTACNGAGGGGASGTGSISLAAFDSTLEPSLNGLGSVTVTLGPGNGQYAAFYADYDLDYATFGSFQDYATVHGAPPAGVTYEADDPNVSNIFSDFAGNTLSDANNVGTPAGPPSVCCDVAFALALGGINVSAGNTETVTFTVSTTPPAGGFYIQQTNTDALDSIYLSATVGGAVPPPPVPEPTSVLLFATAAAGALLLKKRSSAKKA